MHWYPRYVPVDEQRARTVSEMQELRTRGVRVQPIELRGRTIARNFWGRRWCEHLESFSEYAARLAHGRAYVRNGSVCHLAIDAGEIDAMVVGSSLYHVTIRIRQLQRAAWADITNACAGQIGSLSELRGGRLSDRVIEVLTERDTGLFPHPGEIVADCACSDPAAMCKHAAAAVSGVGARLDDHPELLFLLRGVDEADLMRAPRIPQSDESAVAIPANGDPGTHHRADAGDDAEALNPLAALGLPEPGAPHPPAAGTPLAASPEAAAPRKVKRTFTYRPPAPAAPPPPPPPPRRAPDRADNGVIRFEPTGELVANLREQCGCSVAEFAHLLQVTPTTVRRWETTPGPLKLHARPWEALLALHVEVEKHAEEDRNTQKAVADV